MPMMPSTKSRVIRSCMSFSAGRMESMTTRFRLYRQLRSYWVGFGMFSDFRLYSLPCNSSIREPISFTISALTISYISWLGKPYFFLLSKEMLDLRVSFSTIEFFRSCFLALLRWDEVLAMNKQSRSLIRLSGLISPLPSLCSLFERFRPGFFVVTSGAGWDVGDLGMVGLSIVNELHWF